MNTIHTNLYKCLLPVCAHLPITARELLATAASTPDPEIRPKIIDQATDLIRKTWPEYFQKED